MRTHDVYYAEKAVFFQTINSSNKKYFTIMNCVRITKYAKTHVFMYIHKLFNIVRMYPTQYLHTYKYTYAP